MLKMEQFTAAPELNASAREIGLYRAAIEQKRDEKEQLMIHKEELTNAKNKQIHDGKAIRAATGKLSQKYHNELEKLHRVQ